jgi:hypothetical protein
LFEAGGAYDGDAFEALLAGPLQGDVAGFYAELFGDGHDFAGDAGTIVVAAVGLCLYTALSAF